MRGLKDTTARRLEMEDFFSIEIDKKTGTADLHFSEKYFHIGGDVLPKEVEQLIEALKITLETLNENH